MAPSKMAPLSKVAAISKMASKSKMAPKMAAPHCLTNLPLRNPLKLSTPLSANKSILNAHKLHNVLSREVCTPPQRVEPHALPPTEACAAHSSQPRVVRSPLSRSHMADNTPTPPQVQLIMRGGRLRRLSNH